MPRCDMSPHIIGRRRALALLAAPLACTAAVMARARAQPAPVPAVAAPERRMPILDAVSLTGRHARLPDALPARRSLVFVSGRDLHSQARMSWLTGLGGFDEVPVADVILLADLGWTWRMMAGEIERKTISEPVTFADVFLSYGHHDEVDRALGTGGGELHVLVVERSTGRILAHESGQAHARGTDRLDAALDRD